MLNYMKDVTTLEVQMRLIRMLTRMEHFSWGERQGELSLFSLEWRRLKGDGRYIKMREA